MSPPEALTSFVNRKDPSNLEMTNNPRSAQVEWTYLSPNPSPFPNEIAQLNKQGKQVY
jgi:hypothetical protein